MIVPVIQCNRCGEAIYRQKELVTKLELRIRAMRAGWNIGPGQDDYCQLCARPEDKNNHAMLKRWAKQEASR